VKCRSDDEAIEVLRFQALLNEHGAKSGIADVKGLLTAIRESDLAKSILPHVNAVYPVAHGLRRRGIYFDHGYVFTIWWMRICMFIFSQK